MANNNLYNKIYNFIIRIKKQGFTLAEALIITVMSGFCMLPILGTMQTAQSRTEAFDHYSKMQMFARSRLTAEIANASFDHKSINLDDEYSYIVNFATGSEELNLIELPKLSISLDELANIAGEDKSADVLDSSMRELLQLETGDTYTLEIAHAYKTSVELGEAPQIDELDTATDGSTSPNTIASPKALLAISVKTSLIYSNEQYYNPDNGYLYKTDETTGSPTNEVDESVQVLPVSLFSFVNLPSTTDEYVWLADAANKKIYAIDSFSHSVVFTVDIQKKYKKKMNVTKPDDECRPWHIAVHPNNKMLAVQFKKAIALINIDYKSTSYGAIKDVVNGDFADAEIDGTKAYNNGGIVFRPDGNFLFCATNKQTGKIIAYKVDYEIDTTNDTLKWSQTTTEKPKLTPMGADTSITDKVSGIVASKNGYLYLSDNKSIKKYLMYTSDWSTWKGEDFVFESDKLEDVEPKEINSIDVSPDGAKLAVIVDKKNLRVYDTRTNRILFDKKVTDISSNVNEGDFAPFKAIYTTTFSSIENDIRNGKGLSLLITNDKNKTNIANYFYSSTNSSTLKQEPHLLKTVTSNSPSRRTGLAIVSPATNTAFISSQDKPSLYCSSIATYSSTSSVDTYTETLESTDYLFESPKIKAGNNLSAMDVNKREILAVACGKNIRLFDLNMGIELENEIYTAPSIITKIQSLSMSPQGDMLFACHNTNDNSYFNLHNPDKDKSSATLSSGAGIRLDVLCDDRTPNMVFALENYESATKKNALYNVSPNDDDWEETAKTKPYDRRDFDLPIEWTRQDLIGMPNGGVMALYTKTDGTSMLEWVGRRNWKNDPKEGKYRLFARWVSTPDKFPNKRVPEYNLDGFKVGTPCNLDALEGRVEILTNISLPINSKVVSLNAKAGNWSSSEKRSIVPLMLEIDSVGSFTVIDYGNAIEFEKKASGTYSITWNKNPEGIITNNNYRLGFYNGNLSSPNKGAILYYQTDNFNYISDYQDGDVGTINNIVTFCNSAKKLSICPLYYSLTKYNRNYALTFNIVKPTSEFPPLHSKKIAIDPNQSLLAILAKDSSNPPTVNFYDFNNYNYGPETQIEGLLVDYRVTRPAKYWGIGKLQLYGLATETEPLFTKVEKNCRFLPSTDPKFIPLYKATTLKDSWTSFNAYPTNYFYETSGSSITTEPNKSKALANKRFFGYLRSDSGMEYLQMYGSEDTRFFFNNILIGYRLDVALSRYNYDMSLELNPFDSGLFQKDEASNGGSDRSGIFISTYTTSVFNSLTVTDDKLSTSDDSSRYYKITTANPKFDYLKNEQTYILKNHPTFITSFQAKVGTIALNIDSAKMIFSRDKAKPILYIKGKNYLWAFSEKGYFKSDKDFNFIDKSNIAITSDGQKLIFLSKVSGKNYIKVYNIGLPSDTCFSLSGNTLTFDDTLANPDNYASLIATIELNDSNPTVIANQPFSSTNNSSTGGKYVDYTVTPTPTSLTISSFGNNSSIVASGGIHLFANNRQFFCFKPSKKTLEFETEFDNNIKNPSLTSYNDIIYTFGNDINSNSFVNKYNFLASQTQSNLLDFAYSDEYQVNISANDKNINNCNFSDFYENSNIKGYHFLHDSESCDGTQTKKDEDWDDSSSEASVKITNTIPLSINKILISNYNNKDTFDGNTRLQTFDLKGSNDDGINWSDVLSVDNTNPLASDTTYPTNDNIRIFETTQYKQYKLIMKENMASETIDADHQGYISLLQLFRTGVKRLTPEIKIDSSYTSAPTNSTKFEYNYDSGKKITLETCSNADSEAILEHFYFCNDLKNNAENSGHGWETRYVDYPYIKITLTEPEAITAVRYMNDESGTNDCGLKSFKFYGSNNATIPSVSEDSLTVGSGWVPLEFTNDSDTFEGPNGYRTFITAEIKKPKKYRYYLFQVTEKLDPSKTIYRLLGFELYATKVVDTLGDSLTPMMTDDMGEVKAHSNAACATPYGLAITGGYNNTIATTTSLLYWPHAINKFDGSSTQFGISRSLPFMNQARYNHSLVWHKGKIYAIGGQPTSSSVVDKNNFAELFDYNQNIMTWQTATPSLIVYADGLSENDLKRHSQGCCSFGNEIFIFGGSNGTTNLKTAIAWNPETNVMRKLTDLPEKLSPCSAVAYGSKIYVFGMSGSNFKIYEYAP